jgi:hypothetical protein
MKAVVASAKRAIASVCTTGKVGVVML